ncbi:hypothetical protein GTY88_04545, partial [Streptomyces sp. SID5926]|nr:hypothetical protein [Streptomyces sp. SID5926]
MAAGPRRDRRARSPRLRGGGPAMTENTEARLVRALRESLKENERLRREGHGDDPVVIVGMGCRYPGGIASPAELWEVAEAGRDVISP